MKKIRIKKNSKKKQSKSFNVDGNCSTPTLKLQSNVEQFCCFCRSHVLDKFPEGVELQRERHIRFLCKMIRRCKTSMQNNDSHRSWVCCFEEV